MSKTISLGNDSMIISDAYFISSRTRRASEFRHYRQ